MEFNPEEKKIVLRTYSPVLKKSDFRPPLELEVGFE
jgi:hypothetical protein